MEDFAHCAVPPEWKVLLFHEHLISALRPFIKQIRKIQVQLTYIE